MAHPKWTEKYRRPGVEIRCIHGSYCLYECSSVYDKETKRSRKKTGKYLGTITEQGGFKESRIRILERQAAQAQLSEESSVTARTAMLEQRVDALEKSCEATKGVLEALAAKVLEQERQAGDVKKTAGRRGRIQRVAASSTTNTTP